MQTDIDGSLISEFRVLRPHLVDAAGAGNDDCDRPGSRQNFSSDLDRVRVPKELFGAASLVASDAVAMALCTLVPLAAHMLPLSLRQRWNFAAEVVSSAALSLQDILLAVAPLGCLTLVFFLCGHYTRRLPAWTEARHVIEAAAIAGLVAFDVDGWYGHAFPKLPFAITWVLLPVLILGARAITKRLLARSGLLQVPVMIVGDNEGIEAAQVALQSQSLPHFRAVEMLRIDTWLADRPTEHWSNLLRRSGAERIVLAASLDCQRDWNIVQSIIDQRIPLSTFSELCGMPISAADSFHIPGEDRVTLNFFNSLAQPPARFLKGLFDCLVSGVLLTALLPLFALIAVAVRADGGPVLYAQTRIGRRGRPFKCLKFRSMSVRADDILRDHLATNVEAAEEWETYRKLKIDPRVTRVGRLLRATSLDELPQLLNVLRMEMSLVGPRPILQVEVCRYDDKFSFYCETRPGVTGLWQVSGRSTTSYARRVQLDTWYVRNWSIWLDISILAKTIFVVLNRRGAY